MNGTEMTASKYSKDQLDQVTCKICLSIMIHPVTLPCRHELCRACFDLNNRDVNLICPFCRRRISVWARKAAKTNNIVNWTKWERIRTGFPDLVAKELNADTGDTSLVVVGSPVNRRFYRPGELRKEYEWQMQEERRRQEEEKKRKREESAEQRKIFVTDEERRNRADLLLAIQMQQKELQRRETYELRKRKTISYNELSSQEEELATKE